MFESLAPAPPDAILGLAEAFKRDPHPEKINLSVGVFQDASGKTPVLGSVKAAEQLLLTREQTKNYLGIDGLPEFGRLTRELLFGADSEVLAAKRAVTLQTPGGTAALRVAADLARRQAPSGRVWLSKPTWPNHPQVFQAAGVEVSHYTYLDRAGVALDHAGLLADLGKAAPGDVVLLHAGCHNPTGVDPTLEQWRAVADKVFERGATPLIDFAYQGFGDGLREDARALAEFCRPGVECLVCNSYSKNFGLYAERVGALTVIAKNEADAQAALSHAKVCVRVNYSNPPKHGGLIVETILADAALRGQWEQEVAAMRQRIHEMRALFVATMKQHAPSRDFGFLLGQRGMFSYSGLSPLQVDELRHKHGVYIVGSGRINVAGMRADTMPRLCAAIASVL